ncbi:MAG: hypothetical protein ACI4YB_03450 [Oscillospiraceae bacterium]
MKQRSFLTVFAALMMALMMLCGCSESVGYEETYSSQSASETTAYIEASAIEEEKEETVSEEVTSAELDEKQEENAVNETVYEEIASANLDEKLEETSAETEKAVQRYYFRSEKLFDSHYEKHGAEFGYITQEEYLDLANELIYCPLLQTIYCLQCRQRRLQSHRLCEDSMNGGSSGVAAARKYYFRALQN